MSDINPDFSFPCSSPRSAPTLPPAPIHSPRPLSFSPQSPRLRKHAHRRSAALSEDLGIAEIASLTSPQMPTPSSFLNPPSPGAFGSPSTSPMLNSSHKTQSDKTQSDHTPKRDFFDSRAHVQVLNSPLPKQKHQIGEPGQLVALPSLSPPSEPSTEANANEGKEKSEKSRKRRSFVQLLRRSINHNSEPRQPQRHPSDSLNSPLKSKSKGKQAAISSSPPQSPLEGDDTLTAPAQLQPPLTASKTPAMQQVSVFGGVLIETPRTSGEITRDNEPLPPTINLDEALSCSFSHRKESILESPFSKASSIMSAVLEEDEDEREQSGSDSLKSVPPTRQQQQPHSLLHKTNSVSSSVSSCRNPPASPRYIPDKLPVEEVTAKFNSGTRTISYVGPVFTPSSPSSSPSRSPRVSFEQVSNLAILDPVESSTKSSPHRSLSSKDNNLKESKKQLNIAPLNAPRDPSEKGHQRRRSLIDRIMRRQV